MGHAKICVGSPILGLSLIFLKVSYESESDNDGLDWGFEEPQGQICSRRDLDKIQEM